MNNKKQTGLKVNNFTFTKRLGEGSWGEVFQAINNKDKSVVAIKRIPVQKIDKNSKMKELLSNEIKVLRECKNDNVIKFVSTFKSSKYIFIVTEFCNGGDLQSYLHYKGRLSEDEALNFFKQILNGFRGLHQISAMHRDFKAENLLLHNGIIKIADLGFAKQLDGEDAITKTILGTTLTMAPEVLERRPYGFKADIWSLGVVLYQCLFGYFPYECGNSYNILDRIKNQRPSFNGTNISKQAYDFINKCLTVDPNQRIGWRQIYSHPLFKQKVRFIYGPLKSHLEMNEMSEKAQKLYHNENLLPINQNNPQNLNELILQNVNEEEEKEDEETMKKMIKQMKQKRQIQEAFQDYQRMYVQKRNDYMFIFRFIVPEIHRINTQHTIPLFMMSKKALIDLKKFCQDISHSKNIFNLKKFFQKFTETESYKNILLQVKTDIQIVQIQTFNFSDDITHCNPQIEEERINFQTAVSAKFGQLMDETMNTYWHLLAEVLNGVSDERKKQKIIYVIQAVEYYKNNKQPNAEQFDTKMTMIDFQESESKIHTKYMSSFMEV